MYVSREEKFSLDLCDHFLSKIVVLYFLNTLFKYKYVNPRSKYHVIR